MKKWFLCFCISCVISISFAVEKQIKNDTENKTVYTSNEIDDLVFKDLNVERKNIIITDAKYYATDVKDFQKYAGKFSDVGEYLKETFDCDDFAFDIKIKFAKKSRLRKKNFALAIGVISVKLKNGDTHALNILLDKYGNFLYYDAQIRSFVNNEDILVVNWVLW